MHRKRSENGLICPRHISHGHRAMRAPCEAVVRYMLPSIRSVLANHLYREYGLSQLKIARILGVSQSTISRYVNRERGLYASALLKIPGLKDMLDKTAKELIEGKSPEKPICSLCRYIRETAPEWPRG